MIALFGALGGAEHGWEVPAEERTLSAVAARLVGWAERSQPRNSVLLWMGHGESDGRDAWLAVYDSQRGAGPRR
ncbi:hypothetical protein AB0K00_52230 [Dactylosporangium sp. NPDC049525]|uniref:hypothetical protein n=1 Tax=Dactylosporangium sp. NPDC049525 TaxID=3154730 RepID=UPI00343D5539